MFNHLSNALIFAMVVRDVHSHTEWCQISTVAAGHFRTAAFVPVRILCHPTCSYGELHIILSSPTMSGRQPQRPPCAGRWGRQASGNL
eukprot:SAG31_NODE_1786_length_7271_cov_6.872492_4_plen_88_part_00